MEAYAVIPMEFITPVWNSQKGSYTIGIQKAPFLFSEAQYIDMSSNTIEYESPDTNTDEFKKLLAVFISSLLQKDAEAKWFATRLRESSILRRLEHEWTLPSLVPETSWIRAKWSPVSLEITQKSFVLHWVIQEFIEAAPQISSRYMPPISGPPSPVPERAERETPTTRQITIQRGGEELEQVYDIPFTNENTAIDLTQQMEDKHKLQEAKLRLALAKLKAQRLRENYYKKYGEDFSSEDEMDSEVSEEEDE